MKRPPAWAVLPAVLVAATASAAPLAEQPWGEIPREELFATFFAEFPDADAVVLRDHAAARVDDKFHLKLRRHVRTKIMTENGLDRAIVRIPWADGETIKDFRAQTIVPPGHVRKVEKEHVCEESEGRGRAMVVTFPGVEKGAVLEWEYELRSDRIDVLPPWEFQGRDPVRLSRFELQVPPGMTYDAAFPWTPGMVPTPVKTTVNDRENPRRQLAQHAWELRNLAPVPALPFLPYPAEYRLVLHVQLRDFSSTYKNFVVKRSWKDVGAEEGARLAKLVAEAKGVREWAAEDADVAAAADPATKARVLHARVRDGLATDPPRPGATPASPRDVVAAGRGTAAEKNLVLLALLRAESIAADPVLVRTRPLGAFEEKRIDPAQFDHVLVRLAGGGGTVWLDTSSHCPFGTLPPEARVAKGLLARTGGGSLVDVPPQDPGTSRTVTTAATLDGHGTLTATSLVTLTGDRALAARRALAREGDAAWVERLVRERFGDAASVETATVGGRAEPSAPLLIEARYRVPAWAKAEGERLRCPAPFLETAAANPLPATDRVIPVELPYGGTSREDVTVASPAGWVLETIPVDARARGADCSLKTTHAKTQGALTCTREAEVGETRIEDEEFDTLRAFFESARAADGAEAVLRRSMLRSAAPRG